MAPSRETKGAPMRVAAWALVLAGALLLGLRPAETAQPADARGAMFVAADGGGQVVLLWVPPADRWPEGGWRLEDATDGRVLVPRIAQADPDALKALRPEDVERIRTLGQTLAKLTAPKDRRVLYALVGARAVSDPAYARALGWTWTLSGVPGGPRSYRVLGLDGAGNPTGVSLTRLPPAPANLRADVQPEGVTLFWSPVPVNRRLPVVGYHVERVAAGRAAVAVTAAPVVLAARRDPKEPVLVDGDAPVEQQVAYRVHSLDLFGRRSAAAAATVFFPDLAALVPPEPVTATPGPNQVIVRWTPGTNPHTAGYVVERAFLFDGPYEALTSPGLAPTTNSYQDGDVRGGTAYYYRVRAVGPRGDVGHPSRPAMAQPQNASKPPRPEKLQADAGRTRVRLTWERVPFPVAGYFVERRVEGADRWARLNARVTPEALYDDYFGPETSGKLSYRIVAVAFDNQESDPS